jgi:hypothetical protein
MEPRAVGVEEWQQISRLLIFLFLFAGLGLTSALGFLMAHAIVPSLRASSDLAWFNAALRWLAYPLAAASLVLTVYALVRALILASDVVTRIYPRSWI